MTRKDYQLLATTFASLLAYESEVDRLNNDSGMWTTYAGGVRLSINAVANALKDDNLNFDPVRFRRECGIVP